MFSLTFHTLLRSKSYKNIFQKISVLLWNKYHSIEPAVLTNCGTFILIFMPYCLPASLKKLHPYRVLPCMASRSGSAEGRPAFSPKIDHEVIMSNSLPTEEYIGDIEQVHAFYDAMPTGITVSENGRIFVCYPDWGDKSPFTVAEIVDDTSNRTRLKPVTASTGKTPKKNLLAFKVLWPTEPVRCGYWIRPRPGSPNPWPGEPNWWPWIWPPIPSKEAIRFRMTWC